MLNSAIWTKQLRESAAQAPLHFVSGLRVPVARGVCCHVHWHPAVEIVYHDRGTGVTRLSDRQIAFPESSVVIYAPGVRHDQVMEEAGEDLCIQIALPESYEFSDCLLIPIVNETWMIDEIRHLSRGEVVAGQREQALLNLRSASLLLGLLDAASNESRQSEWDPAEKHVRAAEDYLRRNFASVQSLTEVAREIGIGSDHLRHLFKAKRRISLVRRLNELRIARAQTLLANPSLSLKQIAALCGFRDEYYFATVFRKIAGVPPGQFRRGIQPAK